MLVAGEMKVLGQLPPKPDLFIGKGGGGEGEREEGRKEGRTEGRKEGRKKEGRKDGQSLILESISGPERVKF